MDTSINNSRLSEISIIWAVAASMLLHVFVAVVVPNFDFSSVQKKQQLIEVELQKPTPPAPIIEPEPLPPIELPEPPKPKPIKKKIKPVVKPKPIKKEAPLPIEPPAETIPEPIIEEVIAVEPSVDSTPETIVEAAPTPVVVEKTPPPPPQPSQADIDNAKAAYSSKLGSRVKQYLVYPKIAQKRGLKGTTLVNITVDRNGNVLSVVVSKSSGHRSLDKRALETVKKASPLPSPPALLKGNSISINMPVVFKLAN